ncbi:hypothetical protein TNCV_3441681 [Trichonephila clavipes]|nr:hypothetical protein TNCV_3441681 [Trichonephila clavipes]
MLMKTVEKTRKRNWHLYLMLRKGTRSYKRREEVSENENHTSDENEIESSDNDFDTNNQQLNYKDCIYSKNHEMKWKLKPLPLSTQSTSDYIEATPGAQDIQGQG